MSFVDAYAIWIFNQWQQNKTPTNSHWLEGQHKTAYGWQKLKAEF